MRYRIIVTLDDCRATSTVEQAIRHVLKTLARVFGITAGPVTIEPMQENEP